MVMGVDCVLHRFKLPIDQCQDLMGRGLRLKAEEGLVGPSTSDKCLRVSKVRWMEGAEFEYLRLMFDREAEACAEKYGIALLPKSTPEIQFAEYRPNGFYDWHQDDWFQPMREASRKLSISVLLNDPAEFEGGQFSFPLFPVEMKQGDGIVFPSIIHHSVSPVTSGVRYSLVSWSEGPDWK